MKKGAFVGLCCSFLCFFSMAAASGLPENTKEEGKQFAIINPKRVYLKGEVGKEIKGSVKIAPAVEGSFEIVKANAAKGENIQITLTEAEESGKKVYLLTVENTRKTPGTYDDTIRLTTSSEVQKEISIPVRGDIWPPEVVSISTRNLRLTGSVGEPIEASVEIVPNGEYPFLITGMSAYKGKEIKWDLQEVEKSGKKMYVLTVKNLRKEKGRYNDIILLKTDSKYLPKIYITVSAHITD